MLHTVQRIRYVPVENSIAEWVDREGMIKSYEGLTAPTLTRWIGEMRNHSDFKKYVINPSHKKVFINLEGFQKYLQWRQRHYKNIYPRRK